LLSALPLIVASPLLALILSMESSAWLDTVIALLLGTPALTALGTFGAAITVSLRRGGLIGPVLILPLSIPILIFGAGAIGAQGSAPLLFLAAISLVTVAFSPFAAALALRLAED
jgi:heme exporter protein B